MTRRAPIPDPPRGIGLRQRQRADGSWRVWWEPTAGERAQGIEPVELDADRPTWSIRKARELKAGKRGPAVKVGSGGRTVAALVDAYQRSTKFREKKPATQDDYRRNFAALLPRWGSVAVRTITKPQVYSWYEGNRAKTPTYAVALVKALSVLLTHAELLGWRDANSNPCQKLGLPSANRRKRFASWSEFDALLGAARALDLPNMAAAIALAVFSGQRQADILAATVGAFRRVTAPDGRAVIIWNLQRSKRSNAGSIPLHDELGTALAPLLDGRAPDAPLLLDDKTGKPFTRNTFINRWEAIRDRAAKGPSADELHAHYQGARPIPAAALKPAASLAKTPLEFRDLRRTFGVWSRDGGAGADDVGNVLGNSAAVDPVLAEIYMPAQLTGALRAVSAIRRPDQSEDPDNERNTA